MSTSKGNQPMKFGHLIEGNMRNIFLEKSYAKCGGAFVFVVSQVEGYQNILNLNCRPLDFIL